LLLCKAAASDPIVPDQISYCAHAGAAKGLLSRSPHCTLSSSVLGPGVDVNATIGDRVWQVPQDQFIAVWRAAATLDEATAALRTLAGGPVPRWAALARAAALRKAGVSLKPLPAGTRPAS
jgi:hypothetical protein